MRHVESESDLAADLLFGIEAIAKYIGIGKRQAHHAIVCGHIPIRRMGRTIVGSKSALRRHLTGDGGTAP
jgi:hypothetical protein